MVKCKHCLNVNPYAYTADYVCDSCRINDHRAELERVKRESAERETALEHENAHLKEELAAEREKSADRLKRVQEINEILKDFDNDK